MSLLARHLQSSYLWGICVLLLYSGKRLHMPRNIVSIIGVALATMANACLFISRWSEPVPQRDLSLLTVDQVTSLVVGFAIAFFAGSCYRLLRARAWLALAWCLLSGAVIVRSLALFGSMAPLLVVRKELVLLGFALIVPFYVQRPEGDHEVNLADRWRDWKSASIVYFLLSFNFLLVVAPITTFVPGIVQEWAAMSLQKLTYSSIDSDRSPVFVLMRRAINLLFPGVSINSSGLVSMITMSTALALSAVAARVMFGCVWAIVFLWLCLTDKWIVGAGVASSGLAHPLLLVSTTVLLGTWALTRAVVSLTWRESLSLGLFVALGVVFSLYSYSVGRITWMFGWLLIGGILIVRRILPVRWSSVWHVLLMATPSAVALFLVSYLAFNGDMELFQKEFFAATEKWRMIEHPSKVPEKLRLFVDGDAPMWLGSAFDDAKNTLYYWRRTPAELLEALIGYFKRVDQMSLVEAYLALLAVVGVVCALASPSKFRRKVGALIVYFLVFSYAPMMLSQDHSAYRRGMYTQVTMMLLITGAFSTLARSKQRAPLALLPAVALAVIKAPLELQPLLSDEMHGPMCVMCHNETALPLKRLVTDPNFMSLQSRPLRFLSNSSDMLDRQTRCMEMAFESWEMSLRVPWGKMIAGSPGDLAATYQQLTPGEVLVLLCNRSERESIRNPDLLVACDGESRVGRILGRTRSDKWTWFTFIEKT